MLAFLLVKPFLKEIISAIIISYLFYPLYLKISAKLNKTLSALIVCILVIVLITLPLIFILNSVYTESIKIYAEYKQRPLSGEIIQKCTESNGIVCNTIISVKDIAAMPVFRSIYEENIKKIPTLILSAVSERVVKIPRLIFSIFLILFMTYYFLKDGHKAHQKFLQIIPIKKPHRQILFKSFNDVTYAVIYGHMIVAVIQGAIGMVSFMLLGLPSPILLGTIMTITALIPYLGAAAVWLPSSLILIINGILQQNNALLIKGVILFIIGIFISTIDNILRPKMIGTKADIHPLIVLIGVLGGLLLFGIVGIIIGPVILAACIKMIELYLSHKEPENEAQSN